MIDYDIDPGVPEAIERFKLPESLGFGLVDALQTVYGMGYRWVE